MNDHDLMELFLAIDMETTDINTRAKAGGWTFWTTPMPAEDWNRRYGFFSPAEWEEASLAAFYSDLFKDRYGFRPRGAKLTVAQMEAEMAEWKREDEADRQREIREANRRAAERRQNRKVATRNNLLELALKNAAGS